MSILVVLSHRQHRDLSGRLSALLIIVSDRLTGSGAQDVRDFICAGEFGLALEWAADDSSREERPISDEERATVLALHEDMGMNGRVPHALASCPRLG